MHSLSFSHFPSSSTSFPLLKILIIHSVWFCCILFTVLHLGPIGLVNGQQIFTTTSSKSNQIDYNSLFKSYDQNRNNNSPTTNNVLRNLFNSTYREFKNFPKTFVIRNLTRTISNLISIKPRQIGFQNKQNPISINQQLTDNNRAFPLNEPNTDNTNRDNDDFKGHEDFDDNNFAEESKYNADKMSNNVKSDREGYSNSYNNGYDQYDNERDQQLDNNNGQYGPSEVSNSYESFPGPPMQSQFMTQTQPPQFVSSQAPPQFFSAQGPTHFVSSPGPQQFLSSPGPQQFASSPGPQQFLSSPGPQQFLSSPGPQQFLSSPGPQQFLSSPGPPQFLSSPGPSQFLSSQGPSQFLSVQGPPPPQFMSSQNHQFSSSSASLDYPQAPPPQQLVLNQPVQRIIEQVPVPYEVHHTVDRPVPVPVHIVREVPQPVPVDRIVHVDRPVPFPVVQQVPVPEPVAVPVDRYVPVPHPVEVIRHVGVPQPYPVVQRVMVDRPVYIDRAVPVPVQRTVRLAPIMNRGIRVESVMWRPRQMFSNFNGRVGRIFQSGFKSNGAGMFGSTVTNGGNGYKK